MGDQMISVVHARQASLFTNSTGIAIYLNVSKKTIVSKINIIDYSYNLTNPCDILFSSTCVWGNRIEVFMGWIAICHSNLAERKCPVKSNDESDD